MHALADGIRRPRYVPERTDSAENVVSLVGDKAVEEKPPLKLNAFQRSLIVGTHVEAEHSGDEVEF